MRDMRIKDMTACAAAAEALKPGLQSRGMACNECGLLLVDRAGRTVVASAPADEYTQRRIGSCCTDDVEPLPDDWFGAGDTVYHNGKAWTFKRMDGPRVAMCERPDMAGFVRCFPVDELTAHDPSAPVHVGIDTGAEGSRSIGGTIRLMVDGKEIANSDSPNWDGLFPGLRSGSLGFPTPLTVPIEYRSTAVTPESLQHGADVMASAPPVNPRQVVAPGVVKAARPVVEVGDEFRIAGWTGDDLGASHFAESTAPGAVFADGETWQERDARRMCLTLQVKRNGKWVNARWPEEDSNHPEAFGPIDEPEAPHVPQSIDPRGVGDLLAASWLAHFARHDHGTDVSTARADGCGYVATHADAVLDALCEQFPELAPVMTETEYLDGGAESCTIETYGPIEFWEHLSGMQCRGEIDDYTATPFDGKVRYVIKFRK